MNFLLEEVHFHALPTTTTTLIIRQDKNLWSYNLSGRQRQSLKFLELFKGTSEFIRNQILRIQGSL